ncbi:MAG: HDIG domain-containing metalloprotein [Candidatus Omnitrophota bacterium]
MIKQTALNKAKFIFGAILLFLFSLIIKINLAIPLFLLSLVIYTRRSYPGLKTKTYNLLNLSFLFVIIFSSSYLILKRGLPIFYIPFSLAALLSIILFNNLEISFLITLACGIAVTSIAGNNFLIVVMFLISGILAILLAKDMRRRSVIIRTGLFIGLAQAATLTLASRFKSQYVLSDFILIANGIGCSIIVIGILPIFEYLFKTVTNVSLLELADFHNPLLQRMVMEAPGTYHHSLIVGNLSDAACKAVGANALLARIGAYYHDIGKLAKPEYFSENQSAFTSKHEALTPTMSKLIIMNHVKEGVELAKKYKFTPSVIDFIEQHHGNSLVYYFYRRALENTENVEKVGEEEFRYPGPKPNSKETAIVLLADSVEAATRALKEADPAKIEELVHKIINNKFIDGQLDECDLKLKDLEKISSVFIRILSGIYHGRVNYPESKKKAK